jgi:hypothetical protein
MDGTDFKLSSECKISILDTRLNTHRNIDIFLAFQLLESQKNPCKTCKLQGLTNLDPFCRDDWIRIIS